MKFIKNENGYLLVLTLIVLTVISIFLLSFLQISASHNKQIEQTSDTYEVTSVAEMGVEYFDAIIYREIEILIIKMIDDIDQLNTNNYNNQEEYNLAVKNIKNNYMKNIIPQKINEIFSSHIGKSFDIASISSFHIEDYTYKNEVWEVIILGELFESNKTKRLKSIFEIPNEEILFSILYNENTNGGSPNEPIISILPQFPNTKPPIGTVDCTKLFSPCQSNSLNDYLRTITNLELYYTNNSMTNINQSLETLKKLYVDNNLNISSSFALKPLSEIYVNGSLEIGGYSGGEGAIFYSKGDFITNSKSDFSNINIYTEDSFKSTQNLNIKESKIYANNWNVHKINHIENSHIEIKNVQDFQKIDSIKDSNLTVHSNTNFWGIDSMTASKIIVNGIASFNDKHSINLNNSIIISKNIKFNTTGDNNNNVIRLQRNSYYCLLDKPTTDISKNFQINDHSKVLILDDINGSNNINNGDSIISVKKEIFNEKCEISTDDNTIKPATPDLKMNDDLVFFTDVIY